MKKRMLFYWLIIFGLSFFLFYPTLKYYFFQDDFYILRISQANNFSQILKLFIPPKNVTFYRPISDFIFYVLFYKIFYHNAFYYHLFGIFFHFANTILIFKLVKNITKLIPLGLLTSFFYIVSANHYMALSWIAAYHYLLGTTFALLGFFYFLKWVEKNNPKLLIISLGFNILGILSEQIMAVLPLLILIYVLFFIKKYKTLLVKNWWYFLSLFCVSAFYFVFRFFIFKIPLEETYQMSFDVQVLKTFFWHVLWSLNIPEEFKYQMISLLKVNPQFISDFNDVNKRVWFLLILNLVLIYLIPLSIFFIASVKKKLSGKFFFKLSLFGLLWFLISLLPVIFLPLHQYPYFLILASIGWLVFFLTPLALLIKQYQNKQPAINIYAVIVSLVWYYSSIINFSFTEKIHWIEDRQGLSRTYLNMIKKQFPKPDPGSTIVLPGSKKLLIDALFVDDASFFLYGNNNVHFEYNNYEIPIECSIIKNKIKKQECLTKNRIFYLLDSF